MTQSLNRCCIPWVLFSSTPSKTLTMTKNQTQCFLTVPPRIGAETLESVPYVMHQLHNDDEENKTKILRPSTTVPAYLLGTSKVAKADDGFYHVTPDLVSVEKTNIPNKYKVTLVDITYCIEHRVKQGIETKRSHYEPLRRARFAQRHILPEVVVIVACVRRSIAASTLDTLRNDLGLNPAPADTILCKTHLARCR